MSADPVVMLGAAVGRFLDELLEVSEVVSENGNGTWYEVRMVDGSLVQVTIEASHG